MLSRQEQYLYQKLQKIHKKLRYYDKLLDIPMRWFRYLSDILALRLNFGSGLVLASNLMVFAVSFIYAIAITAGGVTVTNLNNIILICTFAAGLGTQFASQVKAAKLWYQQDKQVTKQKKKELTRQMQAEMQQSNQPDEQQSSQSNREIEHQQRPDNDEVRLEPQLPNQEELELSKSSAFLYLITFILRVVFVSAIIVGIVLMSVYLNHVTNIGLHIADIDFMKIFNAGAYIGAAGTALSTLLSMVEGAYQDKMGAFLNETIARREKWLNAGFQKTMLTLVPNANESRNNLQSQAVAQCLGHTTSASTLSLDDALTLTAKKRQILDYPNVQTWIDKGWFKLYQLVSADLDNSEEKQIRKTIKWSMASHLLKKDILPVDILLQLQDRHRQALARKKTNVYKLLANPGGIIKFEELENVKMSPAQFLRLTSEQIKVLNDRSLTFEALKEVCLNQTTEQVISNPQHLERLLGRQILSDASGAVADNPSPSANTYSSIMRMAGNGSDAAVAQPEATTVAPPAAQHFAAEDENLLQTRASSYGTQADRQLADTYRYPGIG